MLFNNAKYWDEILKTSQLMTFISHQVIYPRVFTQAPLAADLAFGFEFAMVCASVKLRVE
jgi:hypothetical protein